MNRRGFIRSLGGAVAATLIPFTKPLVLSAPKKAKYVTTGVAQWFETIPFARCYSKEYLDLMSKVYR